MDVLTIQGLSKTLGGRRVLDGLEPAVPEGSVFGFIGQNGAGKTTAMKLVLGLGNVQKRIGGFSRGMKQRLGTAQALLTRPLLAVFLVFGLASPFLARFLPEILSAMAPDMRMGSVSAAITAAGLWAAVLLFDRKRL